MQYFIACDAPITHIIDHEGLLLDHGEEISVTHVEIGLKVAQWKPISARPEAFNMVQRGTMSTFKCVSGCNRPATKMAKCCFHF